MAIRPKLITLLAFPGFFIRMVLFRGPHTTGESTRLRPTVLRNIKALSGAFRLPPRRATTRSRQMVRDSLTRMWNLAGSLVLVRCCTTCTSVRTSPMWRAALRIRIKAHRVFQNIHPARLKRGRLSTGASMSLTASRRIKAMSGALRLRAQPAVSILVMAL